MPRSGDDARLRLRQAALDLYLANGYDATTAAQIAERAGVTERTFFRHFADKREVLFDGEAQLRADLEVGIADAPAGLDPLAVLALAYRCTIPLLEGNRSFAEPRNQVIADTPALRERALAKESALIGATAEALVRRGVAPGEAALAARVGMAAFTEATMRWFAEPGPELAEQLAAAMAGVRALAGA